MRIPLFKRVIITTCNILFPPLAVGLLTGFTSHETLLNSALFLLAVIPSHIHGFWLSTVYFTRKRRARKGKYPGKPHKWGIHSEKVLTGGVGWEAAEDLKVGRKVYVDEGEGGRLSGRLSGRSRSRNRASKWGSKRSSRSRSREARQAADPYTDAQMREAQNVSRVGSQVARTSRHF